MIMLQFKYLAVPFGIVNPEFRIQNFGRGVLAGTVGLLLLPNAALAQLIPDTTLGNESSIVIPQELQEIIGGGAVRGDNLFHSFSEFNVAELQQVFFANPEGIANILTRVTGDNTSSIFGTLGVLGSANLFLLNPNGIIFGADAQLAISGSFFATTAESLVFSNGFEFSATNPTAPPLLTVNIPVGLQMGANPEAIEVQGLGSDLIVPEELIVPITGAGTSTSGLRVAPGQGITLVGSELLLDGGIISAPDGTINLAAVQQGSVGLVGFKPDLSNAQELGDVKLINNALLDASGQLRGNIFVSGKNISVLEGADIAVLTLEGLGGEINLVAQELIEVSSRTDTNVVEPPGVVKSSWSRAIYARDPLRSACQRQITN